MQWTPDEIGKVLGALALFLTALFSRQMVDSFIRLGSAFCAGIGSAVNWITKQKRARASKKENHERQNIRDYQRLATKQDRKITKLEGRLDSQQHKMEELQKKYEILLMDHSKCQQEYAVLQQQYTDLNGKYEWLKAQVKPTN